MPGSAAPDVAWQRASDHGSSCSCSGSRAPPAAQQETMGIAHPAAVAAVRDGLQDADQINRNRLINDSGSGLGHGHQPINPSTRQPVNPSTHQPVNPSTRQPVNPSTRQPVNPSTQSPARQQHPINSTELILWAAWGVRPSPCAPLKPMTTSQSINAGQAPRAHRMAP
jgi:hypothetical protein